MILEKKPLLKMQDISKTFDGIKVLDKVNFDVNKGEVHALIGENGAGKSTLMKILAGAETKDSGKIIFMENEVNFTSPLLALQKGIAIIYQELSLVPNMRVFENIFLGNEPTCGSFNIRYNLNKMLELSQKKLKEMGVDINPMSFIIDLNTSEQQIVEIVRALESKARIIIMDEPTSALSRKEVNQLFNIIKKLKKSGKSIIYISHHLEEILEIADRITVLRDGRKINTINNYKVNISEIVNMMVGKSLQAEKKIHTKIDFNKKILEVKKLSRKLQFGQNFHNISFSLHRGEILGITGLMGAGKTELARTLFGLDAFCEGEIFLYGKSIKPRNPSEAISLGIGLVPEDRQREGLLKNRSIFENISICSLESFSKFSILNKNILMTKCSDVIKKIEIKIANIYQIVSELSGGNQQKIVVGKWFLKNMKVVIFDEPTRGIDVGTKPKIHNIIREMAEKGVGIILISYEIAEICRVCNSIIVLHKGEIKGKFQNEEIKEENIINCITGNNNSK